MGFRAQGPQRFRRMGLALRHVGSSWTRNRAWVPCTGRHILYQNCPLRWQEEFSSKHWVLSEWRRRPISRGCTQVWHLPLWTSWTERKGSRGGLISDSQSLGPSWDSWPHTSLGQGRRGSEQKIYMDSAGHGPPHEPASAPLSSLDPRSYGSATGSKPTGTAVTEEVMITDLKSLWMAGISWETFDVCST